MNDDRLRPDDAAPVFAISVAAQLSGLHPQTLRQYDRLGLVSPSRTGGRSRLYSLRDINRLREVSQLTSVGVNLAGISRILRLESELDQLRAEVGWLRAELQRMRPRLESSQGGGQGGGQGQGQGQGQGGGQGPGTSIVVWRPRPADRSR